MATISTTCEYLTGEGDDEETMCGEQGVYFVNAVPDLPVLRGVTYCKAHANAVVNDEIDDLFWIDPRENEWMRVEEALAR